MEALMRDDTDFGVDRRSMCPSLDITMHPGKLDIVFSRSEVQLDIFFGRVPVAHHDERFTLREAKSIHTRGDEPDELTAYLTRVRICLADESLIICKKYLIRLPRSDGPDDLHGRTRGISLSEPLSILIYTVMDHPIS